MKEVYPNLYVGDILDCGKGMKTIHACQTCFIKEHRIKDDLYLNMIDPPKPLFRLVDFVSALRYMDRYINNEPILIHCDLGKSRSPSIAMIYLARIGVLSDKNFPECANEFVEMYDTYVPGKGIGIWMNRQWKNLMKI